MMNFLFERAWRALNWVCLGVITSLGNACSEAGTRVTDSGAVNKTSGSIPSLISGTVTSGPMEIWPLNLFPSFGVPIFIILHLTVLFQVMKMRRGM